MSIREIRTPSHSEEKQPRFRMDVCPENERRNLFRDENRIRPRLRLQRKNCLPIFVGQQRSTGVGGSEKRTAQNSRPRRANSERTISSRHLSGRGHGPHISLVKAYRPHRTSPWNQEEFFGPATIGKVVLKSSLSLH